MKTFNPHFLELIDTTKTRKAYYLKDALILNDTFKKNLDYFLYNFALYDFQTCHYFYNLNFNSYDTQYFHVNNISIINLLKQHDTNIITNHLNSTWNFLAVDLFEKSIKVFSCDYNLLYSYDLKNYAFSCLCEFEYVNNNTNWFKDFLINHSLVFNDKLIHLDSIYNEFSMFNADIKDVRNINDYYCLFNLNVKNNELYWTLDFENYNIIPNNQQYFTYLILVLAQYFQNDYFKAYYSFELVDLNGFLDKYQTIHFNFNLTKLYLKYGKITLNTWKLIILTLFKNYYLVLNLIKQTYLKKDINLALLTKILNNFKYQFDSSIYDELLSKFRHLKPLNLIMKHESIMSYLKYSYFNENYSHLYTMTWKFNEPLNYLIEPKF